MGTFKSRSCQPQTRDRKTTKEDLYFHADAVSELKEKLVSFLQSNMEITTPQFKEMTGVSRKYVIPLIEYFDSINLTIRVGDTRQLRKKS